MTLQIGQREVEIRHFHGFCGLGLGALGFNEGEARTARSTARFRCIGGIDVNPAACADFETLTGTPATCLDLFSAEQYQRFHGHAPPPTWREATVDDVRSAAGGERPHIVFLSAPCKGFSGLQSKRRAASDRYQALNELTLRGMLLFLSAWEDDPPELVLFENVPMIETRGAHLLAQIEGLLRSHGYAVSRGAHDCGEIGGLAQHRQRFLLVARHTAKVPPFLREPPRRRVRAVGEVLGELPMPDDPAGGPMHTSPRLEWRTWVRLALIEAGKDWRSLEGMDFGRYAIEPGTNWHASVLGVRKWEQPSGTITGTANPTTGTFSVADPRLPAGRYNNVYRVVRWDESSPAVTGGTGPSSGGLAVADPRPPRDIGRYQPYGVTGWEEPARTITSEAAPGAGPFSVADPRVRCKAESPHYRTAGHYGVVRWEDPAHAIVANGQHDNGWNSVADPRVPADGARPDPVPVIVALDGTWHRPYTTLECAALQGFPVAVDGGPLVLHSRRGPAHAAWRERIGNAVPRHAGAAIAGVMGRTLLLAWEGTSFELSADPVWVQPRWLRDLAIGLSADLPGVLQ